MHTTLFIVAFHSSIHGSLSSFVLDSEYPSSVALYVFQVRFNVFGESVNAIDYVLSVLCCAADMCRCIICRIR